jgi:DHA3 family multidrug efflux protein-like MFS transporter
VRTFQLLVANTAIASITNNFLWFALTFWVYLETRSVVATAIIGGGYMLLMAISGMFFGTFVDRHRRKTSMLLSSSLSLVTFALATAVYVLAPPAALRDLGHPSFAITSVFSGLAIGFLGMGACLAIAVVLTAIAAVHLATIRVDEKAPTVTENQPTVIDIRGALRAVRLVPGLIVLLLFGTFNNFLGGVFMALMDPYGLTLMSVETWGVLLAITSLGFIVGGVLVARRGLGANPVRTLLLANVVMWSITIAFPLRSAIVPLAIGFFLYLALAPVAEASEQTIIQRVVPLPEQGRVFGFAQTLETGASPITAFLIGPIAQFWIIPFMTDGAGAQSIGAWFGTGPERGMALVFIIAGSIGLLVTLLALRSKSYRNLSERYAAAPPPEEADTPAVAPAM